MEKAGGYHLSEVFKVNINTNKTNQTGNFLMVQWRKLCTSTAEDTSSIPSWKTKIPQATGNQAHELQPREAHVPQWRPSVAINKKKGKNI